VKLCGAWEFQKKGRDAIQVEPERSKSGEEILVFTFTSGTIPGSLPAAGIWMRDNLNSYEQGKSTPGQTSLQCSHYYTSVRYSHWTSKPQSFGKGKLASLSMPDFCSKWRIPTRWLDDFTTPNRNIWKSLRTWSCNCQLYKNIGNLETLRIAMGTHRESIRSFQNINGNTTMNTIGNFRNNTEQKIG
jgi:hypothetical protein